MPSYPYPAPKGKKYGDSIIVDNDKVFLLVENEWYFYSKRRAHIGDGGMGSVLMGYSLRNKMPVAIKRIRPQFTTRSNIKERVRLESTLSFSHPNLVEMLGCCETPEPDGPIFVVSRFIQGQTIDVYVNSFFPYGMDRVRHVIIMLKQLADAVDFIHSKGIVHLDIKPSNIMVERGSNIRLLDFGIADVAEHSIKTNGYGLHGTPGFAAPEQYVDEANPQLNVDHHTDIYGIAATAYSLITGFTPGKQDTSKNFAMKQFMQAVFDKALSPDKSLRYDTANDFVEDLRLSVEKDSVPDRGIKGILNKIGNISKRFNKHHSN